jgi:lipoic acid synthetase
MINDKLPDNSAGVKHKSEAKTSRIPIKIVPVAALKKPDWIKVKLSNSPKYQEVKELLRKNNLHTVCEEASCPNISECFSKGTATFMIMGDICTRRCPFCDVGHGRPNPLDVAEPQKIAEAIKLLNLRYVVITSVDRDDLRDGGAKHFSDCIELIRQQTPNTKIEILVPDFRGRLDKAIDILVANTPDVLNHNLETVPRLYKQNRPGSDYLHSLTLLSNFKHLAPNITTKSGLMVGLGETNEELKQVFRDLREHNVDMLTLGQYLQPSTHHLPVTRYMSLEEFKEMEQYAYSLGFKHVASGPMVRSSYHADVQAHEVIEVS